MSDIGKHVNKYRKAVGMTQDALGEKLHVTRQTISSWENGRTVPGIDMLSDIAESLNVSVEHIIYGKDINREPRDTTAYKVASAISLAVMFACFVLAAIIKPQMGFTAETYRILPELCYFSILRPLAGISAAVCCLSAISVIADISLGNFRVRYAFTAIGVLLMLMFVVSAAAVYSVIPGGEWLHRVWIWTAYHPYIFVLPALLLFFGINRSV